MDIVDFDQCLFYLGMTSKSKSSLEVLLPYGAGLVGVVVGFVINVVRDKLKDKSSRNSKMVCIDEDVHRLRHLMQISMLELLEILNAIDMKKKPPGANIPSSFKAPLLEDFFVDVAIKYDVQVRYHLKELITHTAKLDQGVSALFDMQPGFDMSLKVLGLMDALAYGVRNCDGFYGESARADVVAILKSLNVHEDKITLYQHMVLNAENHNSLEL
ncbi:hypothetical protein IAE40_06485 [Pseudomonas sp. S44]|uniref:hypothetical protein n=1 Tax=Pseudomonas sp. S44 TaxID=2767450 RepID=UPI00190C9DD9|nr:hypothetical protein [Pseudomonas sp. S44]MBK0058273.1 hypothetical protein [Pseudomonas sp. S44]